MHRILIVEDEEHILKGLEINLSREGFRVLMAQSGSQGLNLAIRHNPDLAVVDIMIPEMSGLDLCRELRWRGLQVPVIILSAKSGEVDRVVGLETGADDYLTKPFSLRELLARIRVHLRFRPPAKEGSLSAYRFGQVKVDFERLCAFRADEPVELTSKEFQVMKLLIRSRGEVVTRDRLLDEVWGEDIFPTTRTVDNHILGLRKKLESDPRNPEFILSIYGEGYRFVG